MIVSRFPYPLDKGDKLRAFYQLRELSEKFEITLFTLTDKEISREYVKEITPFCKELIIHKLTWFSKGLNMGLCLLNGNPFQIGYFYSFKAEKKIKVIVKEKHIKHIYCQLVRTSEYVKNIHEIPKTLDYMDAFSTGIERRIKKQPFYKKWLFKLESQRLAKYERFIFDFFEKKTIISEQDRLLIRHPDSIEIKCVPNGVDDSFFDKINIEKDYDFLFVGNMSYPPNIDAVQYINKNILPKFPESNLLVSGSSPHQSIINLAKSSRQITLTGWIEDIRISYSRGRLFLAPMMTGTGMQNKLLEAMALGIPCITTSLANNAIKARHKEQIFEVNSIEEINTLIKKLLKDPKLQRSIGEKGKAFIKENYSWKESTSNLISMITQETQFYKNNELH